MVHYIQHALNKIHTSNSVSYKIIYYTYFCSGYCQNIRKDVNLQKWWDFKNNINTRNAIITCQSVQMCNVYVYWIITLPQFISYIYHYLYFMQLPAYYTYLLSVLASARSVHKAVCIEVRIQIIKILNISRSQHFIILWSMWKGVAWI